MCGRFARYTSPETLRSLFRTENPLPEGEQPSWNVAPSQPALVVRRHPETGQRHLDQLIWGLVPHWTKDLKTARRPINARAETVKNSPMFKGAFAARRCLIPADAWYEWKQMNQSKQPYAFARADRAPMALAGLWEGWRAAGTGKVLRTFTIITTEANALAASVHDRMPVLIEKPDWPLWLGEVDGDTAGLMKPVPDDDLDAWPVTQAVGSVRNNGPDLLELINPTF